MNMNKILDDFIAKYFKKRLMPGIRANAKRLAKRYGKDSAVSADKPGEDYFVSCFGFQTAFMMRYMLMAFGAVCLVLLGVAALVNPGALEGVKIFGLFFVLCLILWLISKMQSGFIVYAPGWLYMERPGKKADFSLEQLASVSVKKKLTLVFSAASSDGSEAGNKAADGKKQVDIPLEGSQYMDFMAFLEKNYPRIIEAIPEDVYKKAMRKHAGAWGNRM